MNGQHAPVARRPGRGYFAQVSLGLLLTGCVLLAGLTHLVAAQAGDLTVSVTDVDAAALPAATIRVSVQDQNGVPVPDLVAEHFEIVEDGSVTFVPSGVRQEENPHARVSLAIVIDLYRTLRGTPVEAAQQATQELLADLLDEPNDSDRAAFVGVRQGLSTDPSEIDEVYEVPFTNDRNKLLNVINFLHERIQTGGPGTPLYDAVIKAIRMAEASEPVAHRAVIVMTDGEDRGSTSEDSDTIQRGSTARTPVFTVGLSNAALDEAYLRRLAENTGGTYQTAETPDDLASLFSNVLALLRTQYVLSYESGLPQDGQPHSVLVRVRTSTGMEGFQEYRVVVPGASSGQEEEEESVEATPEDQVLEAVVEDEPLPEEEGGLAGGRDWVEDNLLLAGLVMGVLVLVFLALVVGIVLVVRRQQGGGGGSRPPLDVPSYPNVPEFGFDAEPWSAIQSGDDAVFGSQGTGSAPSPTLMDEGRGFGGAPSPGYEASPAVPISPQPALHTSSADRTRILQKAPKMSRVGLLIDRDRPEQRFDLVKPVVSVGRSQESDLVVDHATVSRQHAVIKLEEDGFRLYDMGSTNGTFVDGHRVQGPVPVEDGAVVTFGERAFVFKTISLGPR